MKWLTVHRTNQNERSKCTTSAAIEGLTSVHLQHRSTRSHKAQTHQHLTCVSEQSAAHTAPASAWMLFITTSYSLKFPSGSKISHVPALCILVRPGGFSLARWKEIVGVQEESGRVEKTDCNQQRVNLLQETEMLLSNEFWQSEHWTCSCSRGWWGLPYVYVYPWISSWRW